MSKVPCIALIEADDLIRQLAVRWLSGAGYRVVSTSVEGLRSGPGVQLIVADLRYPGDAGFMVRALRAACEAPILLVSARFQRAQGRSVELAVQLGVEAVLAKPYAADELVRAVRAALGDPEA